MSLLNKCENICKDRAWAEINLNNLKHNLLTLQNILPNNCNVMAVVKANAYGHGDIEISKFLNELNVTDFAVATVSEGITLRENGIKGNILILGYTHESEFQNLVRYDLIQTVVDLEYAQSLNNFGHKVKVHIKIDTGMNRLGESYKNLDNIKKIYDCNNLIIEGIFTHLCIADSLNPLDVEYTKKQITNFYSDIEKLEKCDITFKKKHIQSSYGVLNYPELKCDYARIGIALYGVLSVDNNDTKVKADLKPVLSLKARVAHVNNVLKGQSVGYSRKYIATCDKKIAVVSIGYADGLPRNLSCGMGNVLINGTKTKILGNICMDQLMIDITNIPDVKQGDIVTIIGNDGQQFIKAEEVAMQSGTITNELLSRLGERVKKVYIS